MRQSGYSDQRGIAHLVLIVFVVVVVAVGGVGYLVYSRQQDKKTSSPSSNSTTQATNVEANSAVFDECKKSLDDTDFCKFASTWTGKETYVMNLAETDKDGKVTSMAIQIDGKGNSSMVTKEGDKESGAYVYLGGDVYMRDAGSATWYKYPKGDTSTSPAMPTEDLKIDVDQDTVAEADRTTYKKIGKEACGGATCWKYQIIDPTLPGTESYIWFDAGSYQLRKWSYKDTDGSLSVGEFDFKSVTITAPSPVQEVDLSSPADVQKLIEQMQ